MADLIGQPVAEVAQHLPLTAEVAAALIRGEGRLGDVLSTVKAYETVDLDALGQAPVDAGELAQAYLVGARLVDPDVPRHRSPSRGAGEP